MHIGTSGWHSPHCVGVAYPRGSGPAQWLSPYDRKLDAVEVNRSFYRLPSAPVVREWHSAVPWNFRFSLRESRFITPMEKLREPERSLERWRKALSGLPGVRERWIYFDNDEAGYAFRDALALKQVIG